MNILPILYIFLNSDRAFILKNTLQKLKAIDGGTVRVGEIISRCAIDKKSLPPTCANGLPVCARSGRSTATGLIGAPRALRQTRAQTRARARLPNGQLHEVILYAFGEHVNTMHVIVTLGQSKNFCLLII